MAKAKINLMPFLMVAAHKKGAMPMERANEKAEPKGEAKKDPNEKKELAAMKTRKKGK